MKAANGTLARAFAAHHNGADKAQDARVLVTMDGCVALTLTEKEADALRRALQNAVKVGKFRRSVVRFNARLALVAQGVSK